jgi:hypothetical protein|eukprot:COSAG01_NODE_1608_length_9744_cov_3.534266_1_plen_59_part_00
MDIWCAAGLVHGYAWLIACIHKAKSGALVRPTHQSLQRVLDNVMVSFIYVNTWWRRGS